MNARVISFGGDMIDGVETVVHWHLIVDNEFIANTSNRRLAELFERIADKVNDDG